jgi:hypothetical protein
MANKAREAARIERRTKALEMRARSVSWAAIAAECGYGSAHAACQDISRELKRRRDEMNLAVDELRAIELEKLDLLERQVWDVLGRGHVTVSHGRVITLKDEDGEEQPVPDDEWILKAVDRLVRLAERRAKLAGLDAPIETSVGGSVTYRFEGIDPDKLK